MSGCSLSTTIRDLILSSSPSAVDIALHEHEAASESTICHRYACWLAVTTFPDIFAIAKLYCLPRLWTSPTSGLVLLSQNLLLLSRATLRFRPTGTTYLPRMFYRFAVENELTQALRSSDLQTAISNVYDRVHAPSIPNYQQEYQNTAPEQWQPPVTSQSYWPAPAVPAYRPEDLEKLTEIAAEGLREPQQQVGAQQPQDQAASHGCGQGYAPPDGYDLSGQTTFAPAWQPQPVQQTDYGQTGTQDQHQQGFDFWDVSQINGQYDQPGSSQEQVQ